MYNGLCIDLILFGRFVLVMYLLDDVRYVQTDRGNQNINFEVLFKKNQ